MGIPQVGSSNPAMLGVSVIFATSVKDELEALETLEGNWQEARNVAPRKEKSIVSKCRIDLHKCDFCYREFQELR